MIKTIFILLFLFTFSYLKAQNNIIPNHSFEDYYYCPDLPAQIDSSCSKWFTPIGESSINSPPFTVNKRGSSDYFNRCDNGAFASIPTNGFGHQDIYIGNAYAGIAISISKLSASLNNHTYKEYLEVEVLSNLENNSVYCIEFKYSTAEIIYWDVINVHKLAYYPIKIGVLLTDTLVKRSLQTGVKQPLNICATPTFVTSLIPYKDTVNWVHVQGNFTAKGGERYLTIGNFECNPSDYNPDSVAVYIYIDDVRLYKCDPDSANKIDSLIIPNVFTPNGDGYNDVFEYENQQQWEFETQVYSRWGNLVFENRESKNWDGRIKGDLAAPGVYHYIIRAVGIRSGEIRIYRGLVTVLY